MSLIFTEGFEAFTTQTYFVNSGKWHSSSYPGNYIAAIGRAPGGNALYYAGSVTGWSRLLSASEADDTLIVGMARKFYTGTYFGGKILSLYGDCTTATMVTEHIYFQYHPGTGPDNGWITATRGDATLLGTSAATVSYGKWTYVEIKVKLHDTTGTVDIKVDGVSVLSLTGLDTKNVGTATVFNGIMWAGDATSSASYLDDIYVCNKQGSVNNDFLGDIRIEMLTPSGDGNYSQFVAHNAQLLPNNNVAGIETDASGWVVDAGGMTLSRTTGQFHSGAAALQVACSGSAVDAVIASAQGTAGAPVLPGVTYTIGAWVRNPSGQTRAMYLAADWYNAAGAFISRTSYTSMGNVLAAWNVIVINVVAPALAAFASIVVKGGYIGNSSDTWYLDDAMVMEGSNTAAPSAAQQVPGVTAHYTTVNDMDVSATAGGGDRAYVNAMADNLIDTWQHTDPSPTIPTTQAVKGVMVYAMARTDTPSAKSLALVARLAGTDSTSGDVPLPQAFGTVSAAIETKPGGGAWTVTDLANAEFGVKVRP